jgi:ScaI restriction endonuclease
MATSPYKGLPRREWLSMTERLVAKHPLGLDLILESSLSAWASLWQTTVGAEETSVSLADLDVPATVIGYFFEVLLARELSHRCTGKWRGGQTKGEKDLVYIPNSEYSIEVKTSGQPGYRIYGNRSYGQRARSTSVAQKEKSGYYLAANFFGRSLTLLRFGWIDAGDWKPQVAPTGQMAGLSDAVYAYKLIPISGAYRASAPIELLNGIGPATARRFHEIGTKTIQDLLGRARELPKKLAEIVSKNEGFLRDCGLK